MSGETDAQRFPNCPKSYILKLETPGGPTSILNGKRGILLRFSSFNRVEKGGNAWPLFSSQLTPCFSRIMLDKIQIEWLYHDSRGF